MEKIFQIFEVRKPVGKWTGVILSIFPFLLAFMIYIGISNKRHETNPDDKMMPNVHQVVEAINYSITPDEFSEEVPLIVDIKSSMKLFSMGFGLAIVVSLFAGIFFGSLPWADSLSSSFLKVISFLPPVALIPLIFLSLGFETKAKVFIIFIATVIPMTRSLVLRVQKINEKQIWNVKTLGPSKFELLWLIIRRQIEPGFFDDIRLNLGTAWVYLIVAELIASDAGLGYRINVASRNMDIALIIFYLFLISVIAFTMDRVIYFFNRWRNKWYFNDRK